MPSRGSGLNIAFVSVGGVQWTGGNSYLRNLFIALKSLGEERCPKITLLTAASSQNQAGSGSLPGVDQILTFPPAPFWLKAWRHLPDSIPEWLLNRLAINTSFASLLRRNEINCVFGPALLAEIGAQKIPFLAWIPDFQHLYFPDFFSLQETRNLNKGFSRAAQYASRIILSSRSAQADYHNFSPQYAQKSRVLPFVANVPDQIFDINPEWICEYYHLPDRFIYLPNQFWKHKNHEVVLEALVLLRAEYPEITVVCTGNTNEYRDLDYFPKLLAGLSAKGVRERFIILGMVPYEHLLLLLRQSLAVLQPSLFEGWSTTVEETKSVGKSIILSDIPVHREQNPPQAFFFDPHNPEQLANCLVKVYEEKKGGPDEDLEALTRKRLPERTLRFAQNFMEIVQEVL